MTYFEILALRYLLRNCKCVSFRKVGDDLINVLIDNRATNLCLSSAELLKIFMGMYEVK